MLSYDCQLSATAISRHQKTLVTSLHGTGAVDDRISSGGMRIVTSSTVLASLHFQYFLVPEVSFQILCPRMILSIAATLVSLERGGTNGWCYKSLFYKCTLFYVIDMAFRMCK